MNDSPLPPLTTTTTTNNNGFMSNSTGGSITTVQEEDLKDSRAIIHLDLDAFFAQVEARRLGLDPQVVPLVVLQWQGILAVSYPARKYGIKRFLSIDECLKRCPGLYIQHVPTFKGGESFPQYHPREIVNIKTFKASLHTYRDASRKIMGILQKTLKEMGEEVILKRTSSSSSTSSSTSSSSYSTETNQIPPFQDATPPIPISPLSLFQFQKASVDEVFIDVTSLINEMMFANYQNQSLDLNDPDPVVPWSKEEDTYLIDPEEVEKKRKEKELEKQKEKEREENGEDGKSDLVVVKEAALGEGEGGKVGVPQTEETLLDSAPVKVLPPKKLDSRGWKSLQLFYASQISTKVRAAVYEHLGYTCSTGIGHNKMIAKLISSANKPDKQSVLEESRMMEFIKNVPFGDIRGYGGKLGATIVEAFEIEKAGDLWQFSLPEIQTRLKGEDSKVPQIVFDICRGVCHEPVTANGLNKSLGAGKNFTAQLKTGKEVETWIYNLCSEVFMRAMEDLEENRRWAKTVSCVFRSKDVHFVKSGPLPHRDNLQSTEDLCKVISARWNEAWSQKKIGIPVRYIHITISGLEKISSNSIAKYFPKSTTPLSGDSGGGEGAIINLDEVKDENNLEEEDDENRKEEEDLMAIEGEKVDEGGGEEEALMMTRPPPMVVKERFWKDGMKETEKVSPPSLKTLLTASHPAKTTNNIRPPPPPPPPPQPIHAHNPKPSIRTTGEEIRKVLEQTDAEGLAIYFKCGECGEVFRRDEKVGHIDYHLAVQLSREFDSVPSTSSSSSLGGGVKRKKGSSEGVGKSKSGSLGGGGKKKAVTSNNRSINSFFARTSSGNQSE